MNTFTGQIYTRMGSQDIIHWMMFILLNLFFFFLFSIERILLYYITSKVIKTNVTPD